MSARHVLLIDPVSDAVALRPLADALQAAGARVQCIALTGRRQEYEAVLDAIEQGFVPVVPKVPAGTGTATDGWVGLSPRPLAGTGGTDRFHPPEDTR